MGWTRRYADLRVQSCIAEVRCTRIFPQMAVALVRHSHSECTKNNGSAQPAQRDGVQICRRSSFQGVLEFTPKKSHTIGPVRRYD